MNFLRISFLVLLISNIAFGEIKMPSIFSDYMVLQRDANVKIWGQSKPNAMIRVEFAKQSQMTKADAKGNWKLFLKPLTASKEAKTLKVFENNKLEKEIINVLVGEVWLTGGQSNMELSVRHTDTLKEAKENLENVQIRYFQQQGSAVSSVEEFNCPKGSRWETLIPQNVEHKHAIAVYFAEALAKDLDVPIAVISSALGATRMSCWVDKASLSKAESFETDWQLHEKAIENYKYEEYLAKWQKDNDEYNEKKEKAKKENSKMPRYSEYLAYKPIPETPNGPRGFPTGCFNAKIAPIAGYTVKGVLWYQGEGDAFGHRVKTFKEAFTALIECWRNKWNDNKLPFYFVQLTAHNRSSHQWGDTRFAQYQVSQSVPNTQMAVSIDLGMKDEIHPYYKKPIADRLEKLALKNIYKFSGLNPEFPKFKNAEFKSDNIKISFESYGKTLICKGNARGFEIKLDGKWVKPYSVEFINQQIVIKSANIDKAQAVRYLWESWCGDDVCLFTQDGLPAMPYMIENQK